MAAKPTTPQGPQQVLALLRKVSGELTRQRLSDALGLKDRKHFADAHLQPALEGGLLAMTIPRRPQSSKQQDRLTELGRAVAGRESA